jgi:cytochrome P450
MGTIPTIVDFDDLTFDPFHEDDVNFGDIVDVYERLREIARRGGPVQQGQIRLMAGLPGDQLRGETRTFVVFDPTIIRDILGDASTYSHDVFKAGIGQTFGNSLTQMNAPEHTRYRRIFQKAFLPHVVAEWSREFIEPVMTSLISRFQGRDRAHLIREFMLPYPFEVIYRQLALPEGDAAIFHRLATGQTFYQTNLVKAAEASRKLGTYFQALVDERRKNPGQDLVSSLAHVEVDGEYLPDDVVVSFFRQLINAAGDTTYRSTGSMLVGLLRDRPDQYKMLVEDRSLVVKAIEETLRWEGPVNLQMRTVMRDVELAGIKVPAGSIVETMNAFVGRDPQRFVNPDCFDITRPNVKHLAFSFGPHVCLGQHLARLEMSNALNALLDNFPDLRLDPDYPPPQIHGYSMRRPKEIHVLLH